MSVFLLGRNALLGALGLFALARAAGAAQTVNLPDWVCSEPDAIYRGEFETSDATVPHDPSGGSGGAIGSIKRYVHVA